MNTKLFTILTITLLTFVVSSCGMKRALTLPDEQEQAQLSEDLAKHDSIDVLKTR